MVVVVVMMCGDGGGVNMWSWGVIRLLWLLWVISFGGGLCYLGPFSSSLAIV